MNYPCRYSPRELQESNIYNMLCGRYNMLGGRYNMGNSFDKIKVHWIKILNTIAIDS